ncbi:hypothetical protein F66182_1515 [Fusarium sp. NRRL 66182]|nr:hypothetical protein F66182_1515 [Fusarium sp. NRRL 66182]
MRLFNIAGLALLCLSASVLAQDAETCFEVDRTPWPKNKKCPGTSACCGVDADCMPNRLCKNKDSPPNEYVRGPCAVVPFNKKDCAAICVYTRDDKRFPRVYECDDGSFCCDNDEDCCKDRRGEFLDNRGNIVDNPNATTTTDAAISSTGTNSATLVTTTAAGTTSVDSPESTRDSSVNDDSSSSQGVKIGVGVAVPVAVIALAVGAWFFFRNRRKRTPVPQQEEKTHELPPDNRIAELAHNPQPKPTQTPQELPG